MVQFVHLLIVMPPRDAFELLRVLSIYIPITALHNSIDSQQ